MFSLAVRMNVVFAALPMGAQDERAIREDGAQPVPAAATAPRDDDIAALIRALADPAFSKRTDATRKLCAIGLPAFARLREAYHNTDQLEVRLRIERIVHTAYMDHYLYHPNAFLGVAQARYTPNSDDDPRIPTGHIGIAGRYVTMRSMATSTATK